MFTTIFKNWLYFSVPEITDLKVKLQKKKERKKVKLQWDTNPHHSKISKTVQESSHHTLVTMKKWILKT